MGIDIVYNGVFSHSNISRLSNSQSIIIKFGGKMGRQGIDAKFYAIVSWRQADNLVSALRIGEIITRATAIVAAYDAAK